MDNKCCCKIEIKMMKYLDDLQKNQHQDNNQTIHSIKRLLDVVKPKFVESSNVRWFIK